MTRLFHIKKTRKESPIVATGKTTARKQNIHRFCCLSTRKPGPSTMNLERVPNEEKLNLCRKYYLGGFALLPFLWLVNVIWFFKEAFLKPSFTEQVQIKTYVKRSALGVLLWAVVLCTWITVFQHFRAEWGEVGDYLSFTIPLGTP